MERKRIDWDKVDWTQRDSDIAATIGLSMARVNQVRRARGEAPAKHGRSYGKALAIRKWLAEHPEYQRKTYRELMDLLPIRVEFTTLCNIAKQEGFAVRTQLNPGITVENLHEMVKIGEGEDPCWVWPTKNEVIKGYPRIGGEPAHHYIYKLVHGEMPAAGKLVLHSCGNNKCVKPTHLFAGTRRDLAIKRWETQRQKAPYGKALLTPAEVREIRHYLRRSRITPQRLAARYNVSLNTIYRIGRGDGWKEIDTMTPEREAELTQQIIARREQDNADSTGGTG